MRRFRVALAQINCTVGDFRGNLSKITARLDEAERLGADLVAFPELAIPGYPPEDLVLRREFVQDNLRALDTLRAASAGKHVTAVVGFVDLGADVYNAAALVHDGEVRGRYHKRYLPNYGVFDEARTFRPGTGAPVFEVAGVPVGITICEDIWYAGGPAQEQVLAGAEVLININGSPFHHGKVAARERMLATRASDYAAALCYVNLVGGQDMLIFDGGSLVLDPQGRRTAAAPLFEETLLLADVSPDWVSQVRLHDPRLRRLATETPAPTPISRPRSEAPPALDPPPNAPWPGEVEQVYRALVQGTRDYVRKTGFERVVIALSGGVDSSLTAAIAVAALGAEHVVGVAMPSRYSSEGSLADAQALAENLGVRLITIPIEGPFQAMLEALAPSFAGVEPNVAEENLQARIRGTLIMGLSNKFGWMVLSTSNKSESATGYTTLYGDMTGGLAVIQDVPKTLVFRLSAHVNARAGRAIIPQSVLDKPPSAELRPNQFDEQSLMPYAQMDPILEKFVEEDRSVGELVAQGHDEAAVRRVMQLVAGAEYKRRQAPPGLKITPRAFGKERRFPIASAYRGF